MIHRIGTLLTLLLIAWFAPALAGAQTVARGEAAAAPARADDLVRAARREQARFERIRRNNAPQTWTGGSGGECDERIGRFCLIHTHSDAPSWEPPPEKEVVVDARHRLVEALSAAAAAAPADGWVAGQRVRYLLEMRRYEAAIAAARAECGAEEWWCRALDGFALHHAGRADEAERAFDAALSAMPERQRREWLDLSLILPRCVSRDYGRMGDGERAAFEERFWRLADPIVSIAGNELRSEHLSRHVRDQLQDRAALTEGVNWGDDLREIVLRFGWPNGWERRPARPWSHQPAPVISHFPSSPRDVLPPCETLRGEPGGLWDPEDAHPRATYALALGDSLLRWSYELDHQIARFRRGDSAVIAAVVRFPTDSIPDGASTFASLAAIADPGGGARPAHFAVRTASLEFDRKSGIGRGLLRVPPGTHLAALEVVIPEAHRLGRVRREVVSDDATPAISDLLLVDPSALPESLEDAVRVAVTRMPEPGAEIGVYWEVYGLTSEAANEVEFTLQLTEPRAGILTRVGRALGVAATPTPVRVRWIEQPEAPGILARSVTIEIPDDARPGVHTLMLTASLPGAQEMIVHLPLRIDRR